MGGVLDWFFSHYPKYYKHFESARNKANKLLNQYRCLPFCKCDKVCVFKIELGERISCDQYEKWYKDNERNIWDSSNLLIDIDVRL